MSARMNGMHVHVALDHAEPSHAPVMADFDLYHHPSNDELAAHHQEHDQAHKDAGDHHQHAAVSLDSKALSKKPSADLGIGLLMVICLLGLLLAPRKLILLLTQITSSPLRLARWRPPLRGPPLHA